MQEHITRIAELFGHSTDDKADWLAIVKSQHCPWLEKTCIKVRKSSPEQSIGTCIVRAGKEMTPVVICPHRFLERRQIFIDSLHLLTGHRPGNEIHVVPEITIPGGSVDFVMASVRDRKVKDFVGVEIQTLDTTGTVWPERQRFLRSRGLKVKNADANSKAGFGMNWKMTAKTILVQLHHKVETFQHINRHFVLAVQDRLFAYMLSEFNFVHVGQARVGDCVHFHSYTLAPEGNGLKLALAEHRSTDAEGVGRCLGLQSEAKVEFAQICTALEAKLSERTRLRV